MNPQEPIQATEDEISLIDIVLFLQASFSNVVKSCVVCLLAGGAYYFHTPNMFEATATIEMAEVAGEPVQAPAVLLEKMKLPLFFSLATLQACGLAGELNSHAKIFSKIKPSINKSAPFLSFVIQAPSTQEAKSCLNMVIADVSNKQDAIAIPLLLQKKQKLQYLSEQLKLSEEIEKSFLAPKGNFNISDGQISIQALYMLYRAANFAKVNEFRSQIDTLEYQLTSIKTHSVALASPVYAPEVSVNKRPLFTLGLFCLASGVFLGLLVTGVLRMVTKIRLHK
jgi:hypothetical protein